MEAVADFQDAVQRDLAWRKQEISAVRSLATQADEAAYHIFRSGQVLLCAHWEGFLKTAAKLYVEHVFAQDIRVRDLSPTFIAVAYFGAVMKAAAAKYPGSEDHHIRLALLISETFDKRVSVAGWQVDTEGNPGSDLVERLLRSIGLDSQLGMDTAGWATTRVFINEHLVRDRHHVAHGESLRLGKVALLERIQRLLELLDQLAAQLFITAEAREYVAAR